MAEAIHIRPFEDEDPARLSDAFTHAGSVKPVTTFWRYLSDETAGTRICLAATLEGKLADT